MARSALLKVCMLCFNCIQLQLSIIIACSCSNYMCILETHFSILYMHVLAKCLATKRMAVSDGRGNGSGSQLLVKAISDLHVTRHLLIYVHVHTCTCTVYTKNYKMLYCYTVLTYLVFCIVGHIFCVHQLHDNLHVVILDCIHQRSPASLCTVCRQNA